ncbi:unnamed protein product [Bursaphelenchus xylophilus]|uniref:(pine wood nematode) hypothetical protein n=1 Tax=Bursaphelenchus xylophilus TaxID=6326 RepID=A0A7I8XLH4_BURXY|nr:unnamed protein product [Bursaphelenchus xylophilus]CAG9089763.1 unnamed protein product [Bursaphelenchus xylophilus]
MDGFLLSEISAKELRAMSDELCELTEAYNKSAFSRGVELVTVLNSFIGFIVLISVFARKKKLTAHPNFKFVFCTGSRDIQRSSPPKEYAKRGERGVTRAIEVSRRPGEIARDSAKTCRVLGRDFTKAQRRIGGNFAKAWQRHLSIPQEASSRYRGVYKTWQKPFETQRRLVTGLADARRRLSKGSAKVQREIGGAEDFQYDLFFEF